MSPVYTRAICVLAFPGFLYLVVLLYLYLRARYRGDTLDKHTVGGAMLVCFFMWYGWVCGWKGDNVRVDAVFVFRKGLGWVSGQRRGSRCDGVGGVGRRAAHTQECRGEGQD